ncbi:hypothetical protein QAD02_013645 [Eretmocerus hayati]|uniref:Uncharacterized protein n=1 Tax=Eretmocerus hayati TaxID=131215 RepID=A0ACC2P315_9HYME|nr:hypothetical protein QAD02_013645 [Eretmocerus hayati]
MGSRVLDTTVINVKKSEIFSLSVDSSPDNSHTDQLSVALRFMEGFDPVERFLTFLANVGHKALDMFHTIKIFLAKVGLHLKQCRALSFDYAANMSGKFNGLQAVVR